MIKRQDEMSVREKPCKTSPANAWIQSLVEPGTDYKNCCQRIEKITMEKDYTVRFHVHEHEEEIYYILSGIADYNDNGTMCTLYPGDATLCKKGEGHCINNFHDEPLVFLEIAIPVD